MALCRLSVLYEWHAWVISQYFMIPLNYWALIGHSVYCRISTSVFWQAVWDTLSLRKTSTSRRKRWVFPAAGIQLALLASCQMLGILRFWKVVWNSSSLRKILSKYFMGLCYYQLRRGSMTILHLRIVTPLNPTYWNPTLTLRLQRLALCLLSVLCERHAWRIY